MKAKVDVHRSRLDGQVLQIAPTPALPRFIRIRDAPGYLGMDKNRFNREVRPYLNEIPTGTQGIAFDRIDLDALADEYKRRLKSPTPALLIHSLTKEQTVLLKELPAHLAKMVLFKVNTGCREQEVCGLKWAWEQHVPGLKTSVFVVLGNQVKNGDARLIVLNSIAKSVVEDSRGIHPEYVFTYASAKGTRDRVGKINNSSWKNAREQAADRWTETTTESAAWGFRHLRVHDLKHTFGRRLRAAGVSFEDRQDLLGHRSHRITTDYSQAELGNLMAAAEKVCASGSRKSPALVILRQGGSGQTVRNY